VENTILGERSMNRYENVQVHLSEHAHQQYCDRVESKGYEELREDIKHQLDQKQYSYYKKNFIQLAGVWWVYELNNKKMFVVTCYGRTSMNVPKALGWAARNNDRIDLNQMI
jgi:hypothetical protein